MTYDPQQYRNNKDKIKESQIKSYAKRGFTPASYQAHLRQKRRAEVLQVLGNRCSKCGFSDARALQIDHVNGDGHVDRKTNKKYSIAYYLRVLSEIQKGSSRYQLLCANCNWIKRIENKEQ